MGALADTTLAHEFPVLDREGLVYLDSSATSQTPRVVIDAMDDYYEAHRASVHRGVYPLQVEATELFEGARDRIARFVNWGTRETNVVGTINPIADIVRSAHDAGAVAVVDGAQAVPQMAVDLREIDADFYGWTGHKAYGPTGVGVLHGRRALLDAMPPFLVGGHMIASVSLENGTRFATPTTKVEAAKPNIPGAVRLRAGIQFLQGT